MLMTVAIITLALSLIAFVVRVYLSWHFDHWIRREVQGPTPQLRCGTFPRSMAGHCNLIDELHEIFLRYKGSGVKCVGIFTARKPKLFILDPKLAAQILGQNFKNFHDNESSQWTSPKVEELRLCSPFVSTGEEWKQRRSELTPALMPNRIRASYDAMKTAANKMISFLDNQHDEIIEMKSLANRFTAQVMASFIWGIEENTFASAQKHSTLHQLADSIINQALECVRYYARTASWPILRKFRPVSFFPQQAESFFKQLSGDAIEMRTKCGIKDGRRCDVIHHLLQLREKQRLMAAATAASTTTMTGDQLNAVQIAGHTTTVLIDGFETAAMLIAHCMLLLARNPRVQTKLRTELMEFFESEEAQESNATIIEKLYDKLLELPYLDQCIHETLRIFPPLPGLFKLCTAPFTLETGKCELTLKPHVDVVYISTYSFHHDPDYFERPAEYWPERFDAEFGGIRKYRDMGVYLPFGDGPRMCPGMKLGLAEAKVAVAEILRHYQVRIGPNTRSDNKLDPDSFLLSLDGGIELIFYQTCTISGENVTHYNPSMKHNVVDDDVELL